MDENRTKDELDFLLSSYRAKMAVENPTESCPFDFTSFLAKWKERGQDWNGLKASMKKDLEPLISQGLFDSILPYLTSSMNQAAANKEYNKYSASATAGVTESGSGKPIISTELISLTPKPSTSSKSNEGSKIKEGGGARRSTVVTLEDEKSCEIVIHVCDEAKGIRQDFKCAQAILVQEMGYFSKVTVKGQRLRDMDISVHCDIAVFDWLMKWVRHRMGGVEGSRDNNVNNEKDKDPLPKLESSNVIGLMVSAEFLQMPSLTSECLQFTSENIDDVILHSPNLGCLNESLTSRLAKHFDNLEMESRIVKIDKSDRISSRLYTQFIMSLNDNELDMSRGHYASSSSLFRCHNCGKLLINDVASKVPCSAMRFDCRGRLYSSHLKDPNWSLANYIRDLKRELKSWRRVYWRLWSTVHFLCCSTCQLYFPAKDFGGCRFHPQPLQHSMTVLSQSGDPTRVKHIKPVVVEEEECINPFRKRSAVNNENRGITEVTVEMTNFACGTFPCCRKPGYKFYPLPPTNGCQFRDHDISQYAEDDPILQRIMEFRDLIIIPPSPDNEKKPFEWGGIVDLTPPKLPNTTSTSPWTLGQRAQAGGGGGRGGAEAGATLGLFAVPRTLQPQSSSTDSGSLSDTEDGTCTDSRDNSYFYSSSRAPQVSEFWSWNSEFTTRYNQDMQREREEKLMADLELLLSQRISLDASGASSLQNMRLGYLSRNRRTPKNLGGSYITLEEKWREEQQRSAKSQRQPTKSAKP